MSASLRRRLEVVADALGAPPPLQIRSLSQSALNGAHLTADLNVPIPKSARTPNTARRRRRPSPSLSPPPPTLSELKPPTITLPLDLNAVAIQAATDGARDTNTNRDDDAVSAATATPPTAPGNGAFNALRSRRRSSIAERPYKLAHRQSVSGMQPRLYSYTPPPPPPLGPIAFVMDALFRFVSEIILLAVLTARLVSHLGLFQLWMVMTCRLIVFALVLSPAWVRIGIPFFYDRRIIRSVAYGPHNRNFLDIYLPTATRDNILRSVGEAEADEASHSMAYQGVPVVVYVTGGAWTIGYKAWGALLGFGLRARGVIVVSVDYRNFPQGNISHMELDIEAALRWVWEHIGAYGGDRSQLYLVGQSAGAHITALCMIRNAKREADGALAEEFVATPTDSTMAAPSEELPATGFPVSRLRGYAGVSGIYDLSLSMMHYLHKRGLPAGVLSKVVGGIDSIDAASPLALVRSPPYRDQSVIGLIPPVLLVHGLADRSVPPHVCEEFAVALASAGVPLRTSYYAGATHTDPIIEGPLKGSHRLVNDLMQMIQENADSEQTAADEANDCADGVSLIPLAQDNAKETDVSPLVPVLLVNIGRYCNPF